MHVPLSLSLSLSLSLATLRQFEIFDVFQSQTVPKVTIITAWPESLSAACFRGRIARQIYAAGIVNCSLMSRGTNLERNGRTERENRLPSERCNVQTLFSELPAPPACQFHSALT